MTLEERVTKLEKNYNQLAKSVLQSQKNQTDITGKTDQANADVKAITPYTETKTAYISDTEVVFQNKPGNLTVFTEKQFAYSVQRSNDFIVVSFEPLEEVSQITISIQ